MSISVAQQMRDRINKRAGKKVTLEAASTEELMQVEDWIEMPKYFQRAIGAKGLPCGHLTQLIGESDTGKTTEMMEMMIACQKQGGIVYLVDGEHKFSFERFKLMGGIVEDLIIMPIDSLEEMWDTFRMITEDVAELRKTDKNIKVLVCLDSLASLVPDAIDEAEAGDAHVSVDAKINNKEVRKMKKRMRVNKIAFLFINHSYWTMPKFGIAKEVVKGGSEIYYMSTLILKTKRREWLKRTVDGIDEKFGSHSLLEVFKGHLGGSKATTSFYIVGQGVLDGKDTLDDYKDLIDGIDGPDINLLTLDQLREIRLNKVQKEAEDAGVEGFDKMSLSELRAAIEKSGKKKKKKDEDGEKKGLGKRGKKKKTEEAEDAGEPEQSDG